MTLARETGDYRVLRLIGEGGMGKVYEAEERLSGRRVALKVLHHELGGTSDGRRHFVNEMAILASLDDPHIVRCLHCTEIDGQLVMALEYLEGRTLRELLKARGALPWTEALAYVAQIAAALHTAHSRRPPIIHRDLKPENVMWLPTGRIKVMDFGIAKILAETFAGTTSHPMGTLQYMSPEQIDARPLDGRSDLYSLGLLTWELLVGHPPFQAESPRVLLDKLCTEPAPRLPDWARVGMPGQVEGLIIRLLEKDPNRRPASAHDVLSALAQVQSHASTQRLREPPVHARLPEPPVLEPPRPIAGAPTPARSLDTLAVVEAARGDDRGKQPVFAIIAAAAMVATVIGGGMWAVMGRSSNSSGPAGASVLTNEAGVAPAPTASCTDVARRWVGDWSLATVATEASRSSWIGGKARYDLSLRVEGCRVIGSGQRFVRGEESWVFTVTGEIEADGTAVLAYSVPGRNIGGTWTIEPSGAGGWRSSAGDVSGTLTLVRRP